MLLVPGIIDNRSGTLSQKNAQTCSLNILYYNTGCYDIKY